MLVIPNDLHPGKWCYSTRSKTIVAKSQYLVDKTFAYPVTLMWDTNPSMEHWNEICAWTVEHFGLPGNQYQAEISTEYMTWFFTNSQDQLIFSLAWGNDNGTDI
jgi:hypothetical protein